MLDEIFNEIKELQRYKEKYLYAKKRQAAYVGFVI